ncbi:MAG TPA: alkyl sulfatase dimerization domain-containing protein [Polyangia bacterium]|nr:alkyl sulfatase dimerization domain-containing protein [Polyangia bacterium]
MGRIAEVAEKYWSGAIKTREQHPFTPLLALEEVAPGVAFVSSFANVTAIAGERGLTLVDTGSAQFAAQVHGNVREWSEAPVHTAVYTHGHIDHVCGIDRFDEEAKREGRPLPRVIAHQAVLQRFDRYRLTGGYNSCINTRQFSIPVAFPTRFRDPDETYASQLTVGLDGVDVELHHARGETDDHTWVWLPSLRVLCTGDLFIWAVPNAGNPQKVQRYPRQWAEALRKMAALGGEVLLPGHGLPIFGEARVHAALSETAELLEWLHDRALAMMNDGAPLEAILRAIEIPAHLVDRPYLQPIYDEPEFIVRNVWRLYGGWWDGDPAALKPPPAAELAREVAALAGGVSALVTRAEERAAAGELALACQLAEWAARAAPGDDGVIEARRKIYRARAEAETSLMARGIFRDAAEQGKKR